MPLLDYRRQSRVKPESAHLLQHARNVHSQLGEDGIVARILELIGARSKWCVDVGAHDGTHLSNTRYLMEQGWSGVFYEGRGKRFKTLEATYAGNANAHPRCQMVGFDPARDSLDFLLKQTPIPRDFDVLSIDIDGNDWYVWEALTDYRPRIVIVEFNPTIANDVAFVQDRDPALSQGCSLLALADLAARKGYALACATDWNGIFVLADEFAALGIADNSVEALHEDRYAGRVWQGFDGTLFMAGPDKLLWPNRAIGPEDFQILPRWRRVYGRAKRTPSRLLLMLHELHRAPRHFLRRHFG